MDGSLITPIAQTTEGVTARIFPRSTDIPKTSTGLSRPWRERDEQMDSGVIRSKIILVNWMRRNVWIDAVVKSC